MRGVTVGNVTPARNHRPSYLAGGFDTPTSVRLRTWLLRIQIQGGPSSPLQGEEADAVVFPLIVDTAIRGTDGLARTRRASSSPSRGEDTAPWV